MTLVDPQVDFEKQALCYTSSLNNTYKNHSYPGGVCNFNLSCLSGICKDGICVDSKENTHAMTLVVVTKKNTHAMTLVDPQVVCEKNTHAK